MPSNVQWWKSLSPQWRQAFNIAVLQKETAPTEEELETILAMAVLRLAGPTAPHPNCNFELTDLSGITALENLGILIVTHHALTGIEEVASLPQLKALFVFNNRIQSLRGIEGLHQLEQLYVHCNELSSIAAIEGLVQLQELYVSDNKLTSLAGLTEKHADHLKKFVCLPNENLKQKEIIHAERELGIICR
jgi:Leucine-rich repeat (LRR) protein